jgi:hypothetical protein
MLSRIAISGMKPSVEELSYAIFCLGGLESPADEIPQHVLNRLAQLNMAHCDGVSAPVLTNYGRTTYHKIIAGYGEEIADFDVDLTGH